MESFRDQLIRAINESGEALVRFRSNFSENGHSDDLKAGLDYCLENRKNLEFNMLFATGKKFGQLNEDDAIHYYNMAFDENIKSFILERYPGIIQRIMLSNSLISEAEHIEDITLDAFLLSSFPEPFLQHHYIQDERYNEEYIINENGIIDELLNANNSRLLKEYLLKKPTLSTTLIAFINSVECNNFISLLARSEYDMNNIIMSHLIKSLGNRGTIQLPKLEFLCVHSNKLPPNILNNVKVKDHLYTQKTRILLDRNDISGFVHLLDKNSSTSYFFEQIRNMNRFDDMQKISDQINIKNILETNIATPSNLYNINNQFFNGKFPNTSYLNDHAIEILLHLEKVKLTKNNDTIDLINEIIKGSVDRFIIIPIRLQFVTGTSGHANYMIIDKKKRKITLYEPHIQPQYDRDLKILDIMKEILNLQDWNVESLNRREELKLCLRDIGVDLKYKLQGADPLCQTWSLMLAYFHITQEGQTPLDLIFQKFESNKYLILNLFIYYIWIIAQENKLKLEDLGKGNIFVRHTHPYDYHFLTADNTFEQFEQLANKLRIIANITDSKGGSRKNNIHIKYQNEERNNKYYKKYQKYKNKYLSMKRNIK